MDLKGRGKNPEKAIKAINKVEPNPQILESTSEVLNANPKGVSILRDLFSGKAISEGAQITLARMLKKIKEKSEIAPISVPKFEDIIGVLKPVLDAVYKPEQKPSVQPA